MCNHNYFKYKVSRIFGQQKYTPVLECPECGNIEEISMDESNKLVSTYDRDLPYTCPNCITMFKNRGELLDFLNSEDFQSEQSIEHYNEVSGYDDEFYQKFINSDVTIRGMLLREYNLSEDVLRDLAPYFELDDWHVISKHYLLSLDFMKDFADKLIWKKVTKNLLDNNALTEEIQKELGQYLIQ